MADQALMDFLAGNKLTQLVASESIKTGVPNFLPEELFRESGNKPMGVQVEWDEVEGTRQHAQLVHHTSPSQRRVMKGVTRRFATAVGSKEHIVLDAAFLMNLKSDNPMIAEGARRLLVQQLRQFRSRFDTLKVNLVASAFSMGKIYADKDGFLLPSSSNAVVTIDFGIPAGNLNQLDIDGGGAIISASWATASTDIPLQLRSIRQAMVKKYGYNPTTIEYGKNIPGYIASNTLAKEYLARNPAMNAQFLNTGEVPDGMFGYKWRPAYQQFWEDGSGTLRSWWGDDAITVHPDVSDEWYEFIAAGTLVPNGIAQPGLSLDQMISECTIANGYFSYAENAGTDPVQAKTIAGWFGLPVIKVKGAVAIGDVTP